MIIFGRKKHFNEHVNYIWLLPVNYCGIYYFTKWDTIIQGMYCVFIYPKTIYAIEDYGSCANVNINSTGNSNKLIELFK